MTDEVVLHPNTTPDDVDLVPRFVVIYVAKQPMPSLRRARTHARSFETAEEMDEYVSLYEAEGAVIVGRWALGEPL